jgi:uncharacterized OB-fold protein
MSDAAHFRDGLAEGRLLIRVCSNCGRGAYPPMPGCVVCGHEHGEVVESCGAGVLYSWTECHVAFDPSFADEVPYVVGLVEIPEGARVVARIDCEPDQLRSDLNLRATFPRRTDGSTLLTFVTEENLTP